MRNIYRRFGVAEGIFSRLSFIVRILLANLFEPYKAEISAEVFPHLCAFKKVICEAKFRSFRVRQQYPTLFPGHLQPDDHI
jgi:hypothetical protein